MMNNVAIEQIHQANCAAEEAKRWLASACSPEEEALYLHIRKYTLARFLLPADYDATVDSIEELAKESLSMLLDLPREALAKADVPGGCTGATAVSDKKVLLLLSLSKLLGVPVTANEAVELRTLRDVSGFFFSKTRGGL